jgi:hypothetical protein
MAETNLAAVLLSGITGAVLTQGVAIVALSNG